LKNFCLFWIVDCTKHYTVESCKLNVDWTVSRFVKRSRNPSLLQNWFTWRHFTSFKKEFCVIRTCNISEKEDCAWVMDLIWQSHFKTTALLGSPCYSEFQVIKVRVSSTLPYYSRTSLIRNSGDSHFTSNCRKFGILRVWIIEVIVKFD
jgi:hypothetical protein